MAAPIRIPAVIGLAIACSTTAICARTSLGDWPRNCRRSHAKILDRGSPGSQFVRIERIADVGCDPNVGLVRHVLGTCLGVEGLLHGRYIILRDHRRPSNASI